jgi:hypothetical protein
LYVEFPQYAEGQAEQELQYGDPVQAPVAVHPWQ